MDNNKALDKPLGSSHTLYCPTEDKIAIYYNFNRSSLKD